jgi:hypothetical protein
MGAADPAHGALQAAVVAFMLETLRGMMAGDSSRRGGEFSEDDVRDFLRQTETALELDEGTLLAAAAAAFEAHGAEFTWPQVLVAVPPEKRPEAMAQWVKEQT